MAGPLRPLTMRQEAFAVAYASHHDATRAAVEAGYSATSAPYMASRLVKHSDVTLRVRQLTSEALRQEGTSASDVLREVAAIATANITDVMEWGDNGVVVVRPSSQLSRATSAAIKKVKATTRSGDGWSQTTIEVEMHDKLSAARLLADLELYGRAGGLKVRQVEAQVATAEAAIPNKDEAPAMVAIPYHRPSFPVVDLEPSDG